MQYLWNITLEDYQEVIKRAKNNGKVPGDSMGEEFLELMAEKNQKPLGATELNKEELMYEYRSKGSNPLSIETDEKGNTKYKFLKEI